MKQKDMYTLEELYDNLKISLSKLGKMADINEGTLIRIRKGQYSARKTTINKLLDAFSEIYGIEFSLDNVTGIRIEDKRAAEKTEKPSTPSPVVKDTQKVKESPKKRDYKARDTELPAGCIHAIDFARDHGVKRETFRDHMQLGLGPGTVPGEETSPVLAVRDHVAHEQRPKPSRPHETERYLTADQQHAALEFWQRHNVTFEPCNKFDCWCHTLKIGDEN